jgi:hypothetical protein
MEKGRRQKLNKEIEFFDFGKNVTVARLVSFFMDVSSEMDPYDTPFF